MPQRAHTGAWRAKLMMVMPDTIWFVVLDSAVRSLMLLMTVIESMAATRPVKAARATEAKEKNFMMTKRGGLGNGCWRGCRKKVGRCGARWTSED
jgi:hypothetical protein